MTPAKDKIVLITGASKGVGRGIALKLATAGYALALNYSSNDAAAEETRTAVQNLGAAAWARMPMWATPWPTCFPPRPTL